MKLDCARQRLGVRGRAERFTALEPTRSPLPGGELCFKLSSRGPLLGGAGVGWFMVSDNLQTLDANWCDEPLEIPLIRPAGTFSPSGGEGWDEGVRFTGADCFGHGSIIS
jgi:hypothetical protein